MVDLVMMILTIISTIATVWSAIKPSSCESVRLEKGVVLNNNRTIIVQNITYGNVGNSTYNSCAGYCSCVLYWQWLPLSTNIFIWFLPLW